MKLAFFRIVCFPHKLQFQTQKSGQIRAFAWAFCKLICMACYSSTFSLIAFTLQGWLIIKIELKVDGKHVATS